MSSTSKEAQLLILKQNQKKKTAKINHVPSNHDQKVYGSKHLLPAALKKRSARSTESTKTIAQFKWMLHVINRTKRSKITRHQGNDHEAA